MSWKVVYYACNRGHFFAGAACPVDGFTSEVITAAEAVVSTLRAEGELLSLDVLAERGVSTELLRGSLAIEFATRELAWRSFRPEQVSRNKETS